MDGGELVQGWFRVSEPEPGVFAIDEPLHDERVCSHLILGEDRALLVDTGMGMADLRAVVRSLTDLPVTVLISHAHFDHVGSTADFAGESDILVHPLEADRLRRGVDNGYLRRFLTPDHLLGPLPAGIDPETFAIPGAEPTGAVEDGDVIDLGGRRLEVLHCPGHSPGLLALLDRDSGLLFTTDVIYGGRLYAHLPGVDLPAYRETVGRLAALVPVVRARDSSPRVKRSNRVGRSFLGMPGPLSSTDMRTPSSMRLSEVTTGVPAGVCVRALLKRFAMTWCRRAGSPTISTGSLGSFMSHSWSGLAAWASLTALMTIMVRSTFS